MVVSRWERIPRHGRKKKSKTAEQKTKNQTRSWHMNKGGSRCRRKGSATRMGCWNEARIHHICRGAFWCTQVTS